MTQTKDTVETGNSPAEFDSSLPQSRPKPESPHLRADAVSLEVPVKVHGSLVPNVAPGVAPQAQPFEEQTSTMIVFPEGGVLKMSTGVTVGQVMVLTNLKSRQDAICRVLKIRAYAKGQSYVEVEFTSPQPAYWGVYFPADGSKTARTARPESAVPPASGASSAAWIAEDRAPDVPLSPNPSLAATSSPREWQAEASARAEAAPPVLAPLGSPKPKFPESSFISIGAKEDVLPPAAATRRAVAGSSFDAAKNAGASDEDEITNAIDQLIVRPAPPKIPHRPEPSEHSASAPAAFPSVPDQPASRFSPATSSDPERPAPKQMFGVAFDSAAGGETVSPRTGSRVVLPIGIAALLAFIAGGAYYFHFRAAKAAVSPALASSPASPSAMAQDSPARAIGSMASDATQHDPDQPGTAAQPVEAMTPNRTPVDTQPSNSLSRAVYSSETRAPESFVKPGEPSSPAAPTGATVAQAQPSVAIPSAFGSLNTHPVIKLRNNDNAVGEAPAVQPRGNPAPAAGAFSGTVAPPPPKFAAAPKAGSDAPVRVGGDVLPPQLISSVLPTYPSLAEQTGVAGTVVIDTTINTEGRVAKTKVISGPELLRASALRALRQWRYAPSTLNGRPISIEMIVSIRFHR